MIIVRIGNNIHVLWKIYNNTGSKYSLSGKVRKLWLSSAALEKEIDTYQIQYRNELVFTIDAGDLTRYGTYKLVLQLSESDSQTEDATYDLTQLFQIVARTYPGACKELDGEVDVQVTSVLNNVVVERIEGLSAYEIAVNEGYVGTESEWIESLNGVGIASIDQTVIAVDDGSYNEVTFTMTNGETYTIRIRNGSKSAGVTRDDIIFALGYTPVTPAELAAKTDVFFATYNSTTWQEINEAVNAGKAVFLKKDEDIYPLVGDGGVTPKLWEFAFVDTSLDHHRAVCHNDDTWQSGIRGLASVIDLASKQDVISDLAAIRAGAALGSTAYQKPSTGIPASDMASGVIPDISGKQDTLVSGSNIKTINGASILGPGNIEVQTEITMDNVPTSGSNNPVKSGGLYTELAEKIGSQDIDNVVELTLAQYNALATKDARTMYIVSDSAIPSDHVGVASLVQTTTSTEDGGTNVWTCTLTNGQSFTLEVKNGNQGNSGYSGAAGELEVVNNVTQGGATAALSAEMGKQLEGEISQLGLKSQKEVAIIKLEQEGKIIGQDVDKLFELGSISISNTGWAYSNSDNRVRTKEGVTIPLKRGDTITLSSYTNARYYLGMHLTDGSYKTQGWKTDAFTLLYDCEAVILLATKSPESAQSSIDALLSLLVISREGITQTISDIKILNAANGLKDVTEVTDWTEGQVIDNSGNITSNTSWKLSDVILLQAGKTIVVCSGDSGSKYFKIRITDATGSSNSNVPTTNYVDGNGMYYHSYTAVADTYVRVLVTNIATYGFGWAFICKEQVVNFPMDRGWQFVGDYGELPNIDTAAGTLTFPTGKIIYAAKYYDVVAGTVVPLKNSSTTRFYKLLWSKALNSFRTVNYTEKLASDEIVIGGFVTNGQATYDTFYSASLPFNYTIDYIPRTLDKVVPETRTALFRSVNHRGYNSVAPENTLPAFRLSAKKGFRAVETDVRFTSDGVPVLLHDSTLNRTARNADGTEITSTINIADITYAEALTYDFGIWKGSTYAGTKIPTFEQFLICCRNLGLDCYVEVKVSGGNYMQRLVDIAKKYNIESNITWLSFGTSPLSQLLTILPNARIGLVLNDDVTTSDIDAISALSASDAFIDANITTLTSAGVTLCETNNIPLEVYVVDTEAQVEVLDNYVSGATSNDLVISDVIYRKELSA